MISKKIFDWQYYSKKFYNLISEFNNITGIPVLLNTSFNLNGEPIVKSPTDAIRTFHSCGLDILVLQDYVIEKNENVGGLAEYANSLNCRFIILSNGISHYLWDLKQGNPFIIQKFPSQEDLEMKTTFNPPRDEEEEDGVNKDYLTSTHL